jgi:hypothetical protein
MKDLLLSVLFVVCCALVGCQRSGNGPSNDNASATQSPAPALAVQSRAPPLSDVSESRLLDAFQSKDFDRAITIMNEVKGARYSGHLVSVLTSLWNGTEMNGVDKEFVSHPRVRIEIADALAQMERNGYQGLDKGAFAQYARKLVTSNDPQVARQAILVLGIAGNVDDMSLLEKLAEGSSENRFRPAVVALADNCATTNALIEKLRGGLTEQWRKDFLAKTWEQSSQFRACPSR